VIIHNRAPETLRTARQRQPRIPSSSKGCWQEEPKLALHTHASLAESLAETRATPWGVLRFREQTNGGGSHTLIRRQYL